jgi:type IV pilus biogenesis protein CpaD/CtpE
MKRLILLAGLALAACADPHQSLSPDFGNSVSANIAAQVVNPNPAIAGGPTDMDGQRLGNAIDRYRNNKVYKPHLPLEGGKVFDQPQAQ